MGCIERHYQLDGFFLLRTGEQKFQAKKSLILRL
jgi:hypothetical protein